MRIFLIAIAFVFLSLIQYYPVRNVYFLSDDFIWLYHAKEASVSNLLTNYIDADNFFYRPTTKAYFFVTYRLFGLNPALYHIVQFILHGLVGFLIFLVSKEVFVRTRFVDKASLFAAITAALFVVHPVHTEVVLWVSAITELIPALCILLSLVLITHYRNVVSQLILYVIAIGAHEYSIMMPAILFAWLFFLRKITLSLHDVRKLIYQERSLFGFLFLVGTVYLGLRFVAQSHWQGGDYSYSLVNLPFNLVGNSMSYILFSVIGPGFYDYYVMTRSLFKQNIAVAVVFALGFGCALLFLRIFIKRTLVLLSMVFLLGLAAFLPLGTIAERYVYFSAWLVYVGSIYGIYWILQRCFKKTAYREFLGVAFFFIGLFAVLTYGSFSSWHSASAEVRAVVGYFESQCYQYADGDVISIDSPTNRIGRAWVFQVGVEEAASIICNKELTVIRL